MNTYISATYANDENTAVIAITEGCGAIAISAADRPDGWAQLLASGVEIAPYEAPVLPPAADPIEAAKAFLLANPAIATALGVKQA